MEPVADLATIESPAGRVNLIETPSGMGSSVSILCIHGLFCDASIFSYAAGKLSEMGFNVHSIDLPGHGKSYGPPGDLDFDESLQAIAAVISEIRKKSSKVFLLAHSMGSTFALWYSYKFQNSVDGLILLSPYIRIPGIKRSDAEPDGLGFLYLLFGRMFSPRKRIDARKVLPGYIRIGGTQYARMVSTSSVNFSYSYRYMIDVIARRNSMLDELSAVTCPVLVICGRQDKNVYPAVSEKFFEMLRSGDKSISVLDCNHWFYDAVFYSQSPDYAESARMDFLNLVAKWVESRAAGVVT